jgi:hypothetical protein
VSDWLIDKSALVRLTASPDAAEWAGRAGLRQPPPSSMPVEHQTPATEDRAVEILALLADRRQHRAPSIR